MWIPKWLGVPYCILHAKYKGMEFGFEEARKELGMPTSRLLKVLSELGKAGLLVSRSGRMRRYILTDFDRFALGVKAARDLEGLDTTQKLRKSYNEHRIKYLIVGASAAFLYHAYQFPVRQSIEVFPGDYGYWLNLLPEAELSPKLSDEKFMERREVDGLFVSPPERVISEALEEGVATSILDATSLIVSEKGKRLDWKQLEGYALRHNIISELGAVLEALDMELIKEFGESLIPRKNIDELFTHVKKIGRIKQYPKVTLAEDKTYLSIGEKWRLRLLLPSYVIRKPVQDLAPFTLGVV